MMKGQAHTGFVPPADKESGVANGENIPVAGQGLSEETHRCSDHCSRRIGLPHQTGPKLPTVQRCPWNNTTHNTGTAYLDCHIKEASKVYRNICVECGLEVPGLKWLTHQKRTDNEQAKIPLDFQIQIDKTVVTNQSDIRMVYKQTKGAVMLGVAMPTEYRSTKNAKGLKVKYAKWKVTATTETDTTKRKKKLENGL